MPLKALDTRLDFCVPELKPGFINKDYWQSHQLFNPVCQHIWYLKNINKSPGKPRKLYKIKIKIPMELFYQALLEGNNENACFQNSSNVNILHLKTLWCKLRHL